jgi:hypothetical protein
MTLQDELANLDTILDAPLAANPQRKFIREGKLVVSTENPGEAASKPRKCRAYLFNDMVLLAKKTMHSGAMPPSARLTKMAKVLQLETKYHVFGQIPFYRTVMHDKDSDTGDEHSFVLVEESNSEMRDAQHTHTFTTLTADEKQNWMMDILGGMKEMHHLQGMCKPTTTTTHTHSHLHALALALALSLALSRSLVCTCCAWLISVWYSVGFLDEHRT